MRPLTSYGPAEITHGPMFIGLLFNAILFGAMGIQSYLYFVTFRTHRQDVDKDFVVSILVLDALNTIFDFAYLYGINHPFR
ncbi:hypothetical protein MSAN_01937900 [Mycena sanguinolenta]|uniref:Uncharacterized protein n=1 Tax=Mycena sanguinolenta TaxID=230812 RepID=A0A8H7CNR5_9AGAR|nr:hypothetical protein MSAN_01937900 [Mycena sanguinolenta]